MLVCILLLYEPVQAYESCFISVIISKIKVNFIKKSQGCKNVNWMMNIHSAKFEAQTS